MSYHREVYKKLYLADNQCYAIQILNVKVQKKSLPSALYETKEFIEIKELIKMHSNMLNPNVARCYVCWFEKCENYDEKLFKVGENEIVVSIMIQMELCEEKELLEENLKKRDRSMHGIQHFQYT